MDENTNEVNIPLLRKAVEWAEAENAKGLDAVGRPLGEWYQGDWHTNKSWWVEYSTHDTTNTCGTAYCIAGYVGQLLEPAFQKSDYLHENTEDEIHVSKFAQEALGLTNDQASSLFAGGNDIERIRELAEKFSGEKL